MTKDISISGNEFTDRSGSGISMSPQPDLTGEQIYVYTSLASVPVISPVNSATLNGTQMGFVTSPTEVHTAGLSWGLWINKSSTVGAVSFQRILSKMGNGAGNDIVFGSYFINSSKQIETFVSFDGVSTVGSQLTPSITDDQWYFLGVTFDGITIKQYLDGVEVNSDSLVGTLNNDTRDLHIGYNPTFLGQEFGGCVSAVFVSQQAFTTSVMNEAFVDSSTYKCFDDIPNITSNSYVCSNLSTYTDSPSATVDLSGSGNNWTTTGAVTYTNQGLSVECTN